jgi:hypothetical protein
MVHFLAPREFGNAETDAVVLLSLVDTFGVRERSKHDIDAAAHIIERGFLGRRQSAVNERTSVSLTEGGRR